MKSNFGKNVGKGVMLSVKNMYLMKKLHNKYDVL